MSKVVAVIEDPDGAIIAKFHETSDKDHEFEVNIVTENDKIHQVSVRRPVKHKKVEVEVEQLFDSLGGLYDDVAWSVNMK